MVKAKAKRKKAAYRKNTRNRTSMILVVAVVLLLTTAVALRSAEMKHRIAELDTHIDELNGQIDEQQERAEEIEQYRIKTQTKRFYEEVAKEKLGLVYEGEIVFQEDK